MSGLILDYRVMDKGTTDLSELPSLHERLVRRYGRLVAHALDKGFWKRGVREESSEQVELLAVPKKGDLCGLIPPVSESMPA
ncbi:MAG: hypothetical protein HQL31_06065 [Planctomycetes bacterium]|nr:hypothetical protein [Planctomycetota bacterium]